MGMVDLKHDDGSVVSCYLHPQIQENILDKAKHVVHNLNNTFLGIIDGKSGVGKSTLSIQFCKYVDPTFTLKNIAWTPKNFLNLIHNAKKGDAILFDEGMIINSRSATSQVNRAIIIALSQIRSRNLFIFININSVFDLDKSIAIHRADILFHLYTSMDMVDGEKRLKVYGRQKLKFLYISGKKFYDYKSSPNFFARPSKKYVFLVGEDAYEEKKRKETIENTEDPKSLGKYETKYKVMVAKLITFIKDEGISFIDCAAKTGLNEKHFSKIVVWARDSGFMDDIGNVQHGT